MSTKVYVVDDAHTGILEVFSTIELAIEAAVRIYFDHYSLDCLDNQVESSRFRSAVSVKEFLADLECLREHHFIEDVVYITVANYDHLYWRN